MLGSLEGGSSSSRIYGVVVGIVVDAAHPEGEYSVKVKFPWVSESDSRYTAGTPDEEDFFSTWARVVQVMAGKDRGMFILPEIDDEVLVAFEHGDLRRPYVLGSLWNGVDAPMFDNAGQDGKNDYTTLRTKSGNCVQLIDSEGGSKIVLQTNVGAGEATGGHKGRDGHFIVIDNSDGAETIQIYDRGQNNYILLDSTNDKITLESKNGDIEFKAGKTIKFESGTDFEIKAGANVKLEAATNYEMKAGAQAEQKASAQHIIKGAMVKIN